MFFGSMHDASATTYSRNKVTGIYLSGHFVSRPLHRNNIHNFVPTLWTETKCQAWRNLQSYVCFIQFNSKRPASHGHWPTWTAEGKIEAHSNCTCCNGDRTLVLWLHTLMLRFSSVYGSNAVPSRCGLVRH